MVVQLTEPAGVAAFIHLEFFETFRQLSADPIRMFVEGRQHGAGQRFLKECSLLVDIEPVELGVAQLLRRTQFLPYRREIQCRMLSWKKRHTMIQRFRRNGGKLLFLDIWFTGNHESRVK